MPPSRYWSTAVWLVLLLVVSLVAGLPVHIGSASLGGDGRSSCLDLAIPPCNIVIPSRPTNDTSPLVSYGPPSSVLNSTSPARLSFFKSGLSGLTSRVALTRQTVSYTLCKAKPPLIYSQVTFVARRALFQARTRYYAYYRTLWRRVPGPTPPVRSSTPLIGTRTEARDIPPTRARTTSASNPAQPLPAHGWTRGRPCTYKFETLPTSTPAPVMPQVDVDEDEGMSPNRKSPYQAISAYLRSADMAFQLWLYRVSILLGVPHALLELVILVPVYLIAISLFVNYFLADKALWKQLFEFEPVGEPVEKRVIHYAYELTVEGHRFQMKNLWYQKQWEDSGLYSDHDRMERCAWLDVEHTLRRFEKEYAGEPLLGIELCLKRKKTVFDIYEDQNGTCATEIPHDNSGVEIFTNEDHFKFDPDPTSAYIEELGAAALDRAGSGGGVQY